METLLPPEDPRVSIEHVAFFEPDKLNIRDDGETPEKSTMRLKSKIVLGRQGNSTAAAAAATAAVGGGAGPSPSTSTSAGPSTSAATSTTTSAGPSCQPTDKNSDDFTEQQKAQIERLTYSLQVITPREGEDLGEHKNLLARVKGGCPGYIEESIANLEKYGKDLLENRSIFVRRKTAGFGDISPYLLYAATLKTQGTHNNHLALTIRSDSDDFWSALNALCNVTEIMDLRVAEDLKNDLAKEGKELLKNKGIISANIEHFKTYLQEGKARAENAHFVQDYTTKNNFTEESLDRKPNETAADYVKRLRDANDYYEQTNRTQGELNLELNLKLDNFAGIGGLGNQLDFINELKIDSISLPTHGDNDWLVGTDGIPVFDQANFRIAAYNFANDIEGTPEFIMAVLADMEHQLGNEIWQHERDTKQISDLQTALAKVYEDHKDNPDYKLTDDELNLQDKLTDLLRKINYDTGKNKSLDRLTREFSSFYERQRQRAFEKRKAVVIGRLEVIEIDPALIKSLTDENAEISAMIFGLNLTDRINGIVGYLFGSENSEIIRKLTERQAEINRLLGYANTLNLKKTITVSPDDIDRPNHISKYTNGFLDTMDTEYRAYLLSLGKINGPLKFDYSADKDKLLGKAGTIRENYKSNLTKANGRRRQQLQTKYGPAFRRLQIKYGDPPGPNEDPSIQKAYRDFKLYLEGDGGDMKDPSMSILSTNSNLTFSEMSELMRIAAYWEANGGLNILYDLNGTSTKTRTPQMDLDDIVIDILNEAERTTPSDEQLKAEANQILRSVILAYTEGEKSRDAAVAAAAEAELLRDFDAKAADDAKAAASAAAAAFELLKGVKSSAIHHENQVKKGAFSSLESLADKGREADTHNSKIAEEARKADAAKTRALVSASQSAEDSVGKAEAAVGQARAAKDDATAAAAESDKLKTYDSEAAAAAAREKTTAESKLAEAEQALTKARGALDKIKAGVGKVGEAAKEAKTAAETAKTAATAASAAATLAEEALARARAAAEEALRKAENVKQAGEEVLKAANSRKTAADNEQAAGAAAARARTAAEGADKAAAQADKLKSYGNTAAAASAASVARAAADSAEKALAAAAAASAAASAAAAAAEAALQKAKESNSAEAATAAAAAAAAAARAAEQALICAAEVVKAEKAASDAEAGKKAADDALAPLIAAEAEAAERARLAALEEARKRAEEAAAASAAAELARIADAEAKKKAAEASEREKEAAERDKKAKGEALKAANSAKAAADNVIAATEAVTRARAAAEAAGKAADEADKLKSYGSDAASAATSAAAANTAKLEAERALAAALAAARAASEAAADAGRRANIGNFQAASLAAIAAAAAAAKAAEEAEKAKKAAAGAEKAKNDAAAALARLRGFEQTARQKAIDEEAAAEAERKRKADEAAAKLLQAQDSARKLGSAVAAARAASNSGARGAEARINAARGENLNKNRGKLPPKSSNPAKPTSLPPRANLPSDIVDLIAKGQEKYGDDPFKIARTYVGVGGSKRAPYSFLTAYFNYLVAKKETEGIRGWRGSPLEIRVAEIQEDDAARQLRNFNPDENFHEVAGVFWATPPPPRSNKERIAKIKTDLAAIGSLDPTLQSEVNKLHVILTGLETNIDLPSTPVGLTNLEQQVADLFAKARANVERSNVEDTRKRLSDLQEEAKKDLEDIDKELKLIKEALDSANKSAEVSRDPDSKDAVDDLKARYDNLKERRDELSKRIKDYHLLIRYGAQGISRSGYDDMFNLFSSQLNRPAFKRALDDAKKLRKYGDQVKTDNDNAKTGILKIIKDIEDRETNDKSSVEGAVIRVLAFQECKAANNCHADQIIGDVENRRLLDFIRIFYEVDGDTIKTDNYKNPIARPALAALGESIDHRVRIRNNNPYNDDITRQIFQDAIDLYRSQHDQPTAFEKGRALEMLSSEVVPNFKSQEARIAAELASYVSSGAKTPKQMEALSEQERLALPAHIIELSQKYVTGELLQQIIKNQLAESEALQLALRSDYSLTRAQSREVIRLAGLHRLRKRGGPGEIKGPVTNISEEDFYRNWDEAISRPGAIRFMQNNRNERFTPYDSAGNLVFEDIDLSFISSTVPREEQRRFDKTRREDLAFYLDRFRVNAERIKGQFSTTQKAYFPTTDESWATLKDLMEDCVKNDKCNPTPQFTNIFSLEPFKSELAAQKAAWRAKHPRENSGITREVSKDELKKALYLEYAIDDYFDMLRSSGDSTLPTKPEEWTELRRDIRSCIKDTSGCPKEVPFAKFLESSAIDTIRDKSNTSNKKYDQFRLQIDNFVNRIFQDKTSLPLYGTRNADNIVNRMMSYRNNSRMPDSDVTNITNEVAAGANAYLSEVIEYSRRGKEFWGVAAMRSLAALSILIGLSTGAAAGVLPAVGAPIVLDNVLIGAIGVHLLAQLNSIPGIYEGSVEVLVGVASAIGKAAGYGLAGARGVVRGADGVLRNVGAGARRVVRGADGVLRYVGAGPAIDAAGQGLAAAGQAVQQGVAAAGQAVQQGLAAAGQAVQQGLAAAGQAVQQVGQEFKDARAMFTDQENREFDVGVVVLGEGFLIAALEGGGGLGVGAGLLGYSGGYLGVHAFFGAWDYVNGAPKNAQGKPLNDIGAQRLADNRERIANYVGVGVGSAAAAYALYATLAALGIAAAPAIAVVAGVAVVCGGLYLVNAGAQASAESLKAGLLAAGKGDMTTEQYDQVLQELASRLKAWDSFNHVQLTNAFFGNPALKKGYNDVGEQVVKVLKEKVDRSMFSKEILDILRERPITADWWKDKRLSEDDVIAIMRMVGPAIRPLQPQRGGSGTKPRKCYPILEYYRILERYYDNLFFLMSLNRYELLRQGLEEETVRNVICSSFAQLLLSNMVIAWSNIRISTPITIINYIILPFKPNKAEPLQLLEDYTSEKEKIDNDLKSCEPNPLEVLAEVTDNLSPGELLDKDSETGPLPSLPAASLPAASLPELGPELPEATAQESASLGPAASELPEATEQEPPELTEVPAKAEPINYGELIQKKEYNEQYYQYFLADYTINSKITKIIQEVCTAVKYENWNFTGWDCSTRKFLAERAEERLIGIKENYDNFRELVEEEIKEWPPKPTGRLTARLEIIRSEIKQKVDKLNDTWAKDLTTKLTALFLKKKLLFIWTGKVTEKEIQALVKESLAGVISDQEFKEKEFYNELIKLAFEKEIFNILKDLCPSANFPKSACQEAEHEASRANMAYLEYFNTYSEYKSATTPLNWQINIMRNDTDSDLKNILDKEDWRKPLKASIKKLHKEPLLGWDSDNIVEFITQLKELIRDACWMFANGNLDTIDYFNDENRYSHYKSSVYSGGRRKTRRFNRNRHSKKYTGIRKTQ